MLRVELTADIFIELVVPALAQLTSAVVAEWSSQRECGLMGCMHRVVMLWQVCRCAHKKIPECRYEATKWNESSNIFSTLHARWKLSELISIHATKILLLNKNPTRVKGCGASRCLRDSAQKNAIWLYRAKCTQKLEQQAMEAKSAQECFCLYNVSRSDSLRRTMAVKHLQAPTKCKEERRKTWKFLKKPN